MVLETQKMKRRTPKRQAVLVLGMHRSGTSAISGVLARLGVEAPKSLMIPTKDNPKGYWESTALMRFHDEVLASAGSKWNDWGPFNPDWMGSPVADQFVSRLPEILMQEFGEAPLFLVKDPRICRLLPLWMQVLASLDIVPKVVLPVRHPLEVARSLETRNEFGRRRSYLAWLRHVLDAEYQSRDSKRIFVGYADMLMDWRKQVERMSVDLGIKWPRWSGSVEADIDGFLTAELRHHAADDALPADGSGLTAWVAQTHQALSQLVASGSAGSDNALRVLDGVRAEMDWSSSIYASVIQESESKLEAKSAALNAHTAEVANLSLQLAEMHDHHAGEIGSLKEEYRLAEESLQAQVAGMHEQHSEEIRSLREVHRLAEESLQAQVAGMHERHSEEIRSLKQANRLAEEAMQAQSAEMHERHAGEISLLKEEIRQREEFLQERFSEIAKLTGIVFELERDLAKERKARTDEKADFESKLGALENELDLHRRVASAQRDRWKSVHASGLWRLGRMVGLSPVTSVKDAAAGRDDEAIRRSGLFDPVWYLRHYPDVRKRGMDPIKHYLRYGASEGRDPGPTFGTKDYLRRYPDVAASGLNPLLHYVRYGIEEGRFARDRDTKKES